MNRFLLLLLLMITHLFSCGMAQDDENFFDGLITPPEALVGPAFTDFVACKAVSITASILLLCMLRKAFTRVLDDLE